MCECACLIFIVRAHGHGRWIGDDQQSSTTAVPVEKKEEHIKNSIAAVKKSRGTDHSVAELERVYRLSLKKY